MKRQTKTQTAKPMQSIVDQVNDSMKQGFNECRKNLSKDEILSHLQDFSSRKAKKAWLSKRINDRVVYLKLLEQASTEGWKHFYGQPIHQKFIELQMTTLQSMIEIRTKLSPESEREFLYETFLRPLVSSEAPKQPKVETKVQSKIVKEQPKVVKEQPKVVSKPKVYNKLAVAKEQPKVAKEQSSIDSEILTKIVNNLSEMSSQLTKLTEMCLNNSKAIVELQNQPKVVEKVVKQPKVAITQPKVEKKIVVTQPKVVTEEKPKVYRNPSKQISLFDAIFKQNVLKSDHKSTISHKDAFEFSGDATKSAFRKHRMEVK
jgi:hypothetical protein